MKGKKASKTHPTKSRPVFYLVMVLIPIMFFVLLEAGLRIFSYGNDISPWIISNDKYTPNPNIARRYFDNIETLPATIEDVFDIEKKDNSYRIFVLGGSSAAGFPYMPLGAFSRYIQQRLEQNYPDKTIEVVNLGIAAVNSYTMLDLLPDVIEEKPDAILIYAGHNEYYGALGVGSLESYGRSRTLIKTMLYLNHFKTIQLVKDFIKLFGSKAVAHEPGTLMSKMAEKKVIPYKSELYEEGIKQFRENLNEIINTCKDNNIPLLVGTLVSNEKDLPPFVNDTTAEYGSADEVYKNAQLSLKESNFQKADSLFTLAKDLDALRFRAPSEINDVIISLSDSYKIPFVKIDSAFCANCQHNIVGDELMTDHLHPTLEGYQLIGKMFYESLYKNNLLPHVAPRFAYDIQDSITVKNYQISDLDLKIAQYTIDKIKSDYPYVRPGEKRPKTINPKFLDRESQIAYLAADGQMKWADAHIVLAREAEQSNDTQTMIKNMDMLISQYPFTKEIYDITIDNLLKSENFDLAFPYLMKRYKLGKDPYLSKWIGTIYFQKNNHSEAIKYLKESLGGYPHDTQNLYNLGAIYALDGDFDTAKKYLLNCIRVDPNHKEARALLEQLH